MSLLLLCSLILNVYSEKYNNNIIITELSKSGDYQIRLENVRSPQQIDISLDDNYSVISPRQSESLINVHDNVFYDEAMYLIHLHPDANQIDTHIKTPFYFVNGTSSKRFGMGKHFDDENYSLVHYLYNSKQIKHKSFTLELHNRISRNNYIYFGGIPEYVRKHRTQIVEIKHLIPNTNRWGFQMNSIGVANNVLQINKKVYFDLNSDEFSLDKNLYEWLRDEVFYDLFLSGMCDEYKRIYSNTQNVHSHFSCERDLGLPELFFTFEGSKEKVLLFSMNLAECWDVDCTYDAELDEKDYIVFPVNFFYSKIVTFDYENDKVVLMGTETGNEMIKVNSGKYDNGNNSYYHNNNGILSSIFNGRTVDRVNLMKMLLGFNSVIVSVVVFAIIIKKEYIDNEFSLSMLE